MLEADCTIRPHAQWHVTEHKRLFSVHRNQVQGDKNTVLCKAEDGIRRNEDQFYNTTVWHKGRCVAYFFKYAHINPIQFSKKKNSLWQHKIKY